jgi:hypothetical protein
MKDQTLKSELDEVTSELAAAETEYASLGAKIAGLTARRSALSKALLIPEPAGSGITGPAQRYRTDAIVAVLTEASTPLSIREVISGLRRMGRPEETYDNVSVDLAYLAEKDRIARVRRGIYATGLQHRAVQRCPSGHEFMWQPAAGLCPYCTLTSEERIAGLQRTEASSPCPADCCPIS